MPDSLQIALKNDSDASNLYAYITGIGIQHGGQRLMLKANGSDLYFAQNPPSIGSPLAEDCAIPLGPPGNSTTITIPQIAGGRIWISEGNLTFLLNPGPALVEPSVLNPSDPNANVNFGFCEFTLNNDQLYANISYVDFAPRIPIAITLQQASGQVQHVMGMAPNGLDQLAEGLRQQAQKDGRPWDKLTVNREGRNLRVLNATHGGAVGASFEGYYEPHIEEVWSKYSSNHCMKVNTQAGPGVLEGRIESNGKLMIGDEAFDKPNSADVFGCNSGPFTTGPSATRNAIIPRLAAAFHRSTLLACEEHPSDPSTFYATDPTNHYARLVHQVNLDRKGYAFAYDDVQPDGGEDQSGKVNAGDPVLFTVTVGGKSAAGGAPPDTANQQPQQQTYDRPPPPPPPGQEQQQHQEGGFRGKLRGFADKFMR
ncbi:glycoside hydrolase family 64 protein [Baudoinia panamericana UAMH 10762]|uniref:Glycoside hydrolase family 64 protein n=1 Tax=Baudoinia panamericana (strain UAMH 10762) TaxID=717646 RepID=M2MQL8_BAUPA|nr:glycoside hydrolase family 64 protein [Baudoinia panamericana UAMH 10762]EMC93788.1 glycoside hydrolase family 64 protein [Baudoinia panamericana UAMH 10762]